VLERINIFVPKEGVNLWDPRRKAIPLAILDGVFIGENNQSGWDVNQKLNTALDNAGNYDILQNNLFFLSDNDLIDNPTTDPDLTPTIQQNA
jgi:hypothetical protein